MYAHLSRILICAEEDVIEDVVEQFYVVRLLAFNFARDAQPLQPQRRGLVKS